MLDIPLSHSKKFHPFLYNFKNAWADNGDYISLHYAGTGSTTSQVTRTSKTGFVNMLDHGMKSIGRFFINNFEDHIKQEAIDLTLGQKNENYYMSKYEETLESELMCKKHEYITFTNVKVFITTLNLNYFRPPNEKFEFEIFKSFENLSKLPDLIVVGLQETEKFNLNNFLSFDSEKISTLWQNIIKNNVNQYDSYFEIAHLNFYGCFLMVLAKSHLKERIKRIRFDEINFSAMNKFSKKGAVLIKFHIDDSSLCFVNAHLDSGTNNLKERVNNLNTIHDNSFNEDIENFEYKFLLGDFNFRIVTLKDQEIRKNIARFYEFNEIQEYRQAQLALKDLLLYDEVWEAKKLCRYLSKYWENDIEFLPTYKYEANSDKYDIKKTPAW